MNVRISPSRRLYTSSIRIAAPVDRVFDYFRNPESSWVSMGVKVHNIRATPEGLGTTFDWEARVFGFGMAGTNEITQYAPNERLVITASRGFVWTFDFEPDGEVTMLTFGLDDASSNWAEEAFDTVATKLSEHNLDTWLANAKAELETGTARPRRVERHLADRGKSVMAEIGRLKQVVNARLQQAFWNWAGVPTGPLGWVSSHTLLWSGSYPAVADALRLRPDDELLELGCGSAGFLAGQADRVRRVSGIDLSDIQVSLARRRLAVGIARGTAQIVKGDAADLPWPDGSFTVVTCMSVFETFPDPEQVLREVFRVLRPAGRAVLNIGERVAEGTQTHKGWAGIPVWAEDDVRRMVEEAGFAHVTIQYVPWGKPNLGNRLFAKIVGPIGGDLRLASGIKP